MADEPEVAPVEGGEPTTLDSIIDDAIAQSESAEPATDEGVKIDATGRAHGEKGRFVSKDTGEAEASEGATEAEPETAEAQPPPEPAQQQFEPHPRWNEAQKAAFNSLPPEAKQFALAVQAEHEANFTRKAQEAAEFRRNVDPYIRAVQPFSQYLAHVAPAMGTTPAGAVNQILQAEYKLRTGNIQEKYGTFAGLAQHYGVDLAALASGQVPVQQQPRQVDPQVNQRLSRIEQGLQQEHIQRLSLHIDAFRDAKDEHGKPKYPHFERVRGVMAQVMGSGQAATMEDAYALAVKPINEAVAAELGARQKTEEKQRQEALEKAKKAAPVRASGTQPRGIVAGKGLDNILSAAIDKAGIH